MTANSGAQAAQKRIKELERQLQRQDMREVIPTNLTSCLLMYVILMLRIMMVVTMTMVKLRILAMRSVRMTMTRVMTSMMIMKQTKQDHDEDADRKWIMSTDAHQ